MLSFIPALNRLLIEFLLHARHCGRYRDTDGLYPRGSYGLAGETTNTHLCTHKDMITLWWLWKGSAGCNERVAWCSPAPGVGECGGNVSKGFPEEVTLKPSLEEWGVGQGNSIPAKGNCLWKSFQAERDLTSDRKGKKSLFGWKDREGWTVQECVKILDFILKVMGT